MSETTTPETGAESNGEPQTVPGQGTDTTETSEAPQGNREAKYRVERNEARAERDALAARVEALQLREVHRLAGETLANPEDLLTLSGKALADFLAPETGELDSELVAEAAAEVLASRPGLRPNARAIDHSQGTGNRLPGRAAPSWGDLFSG